MSCCHTKIIARKQRIQLHNTDHKVAEGYVAGTLGWRSQLSIAAAVAPQ
jgi:hypothetical protein